MSLVVYYCNKPRLYIGEMAYVTPWTTVIHCSVQTRPYTWRSLSVITTHVKLGEFFCDLWRIKYTCVLKCITSNSEC